jgi:hypothetical protein
VLSILCWFVRRHVNQNLRQAADIDFYRHDKIERKNRAEAKALEDLYPGVLPQLRKHYHQKEMVKDKTRHNHALGDWGDAPTAPPRVYDHVTGQWKDDNPDSVYYRVDGDMNLTRSHDLTGQQLRM